MSRKSKRSERTPNELVYVPVSPTVCIRSGENLTGPCRLVRDLALDMWATTQRWNSELLSGTAVISQLKSNLVMKSKNDEDSVTQRRNLTIRLNDDLAGICDRMESLVSAFECQCNKLYNVQCLERYRNDCSPMFLTWPTRKFVEIGRLLYEMYANELRLKLAIKEELGFCGSDLNLVTFYATAWLHQPYVNETINSRFFAMMKEVGHNVL